MANGISNVEFQEASTFELPFEDDQFDVVFVQTAVAHIPNHDTTMNGIRRVLTPRGCGRVDRYRQRSCGTVEQAAPLDEDGLLIVIRVRKYHGITYNPGSTLVLLVAPSGDVYSRIGRDADRVSDQPTIPSLWRLMEYTTEQPVILELFNGNEFIRTDNESSFQGPVEIPGFTAFGSAG